MCPPCSWHPVSLFLLLLQKNRADAGGGTLIWTIRAATRKTLLEEKGALNLKRD